MADDTARSRCGLRILLASDAWRPQVNGVVRCWESVISVLQTMGHEIEVLHPGLFRTVAAPRYPEIRLAIAPGRRLRRRAETFGPDVVHIATEGPVGIACRSWCRRRRLPFTTSYHTQFPLYLERYFRIPATVTWRGIRWFHGPAEAVLAPTEQVRRELVSRGLPQSRTWSRGFDPAIFHPAPWADPRLVADPFEELARPVLLYAGRVAAEKNIGAFLDLEIPGTKVVVGDGPARIGLERRHPDVRFLGYRFGEDLGRHYAAADVLVFPSLTDTYGVVMLEANACGTPVAAYPVTGPIDVVVPGVNGFLDEDLARAVTRALRIPRRSCLDHASKHSWRRTAELLLEAVVPLSSPETPRWTTASSRS